MVSESRNPLLMKQPLKLEGHYHKDFSVRLVSSMALRTVLLISVIFDYLLVFDCIL